MLKIKLKIKKWFNDVKVFILTIFHNKRILSAMSSPQIVRIVESCFAEITKDNGISLFKFSEMVAKCRKMQEKMSKTLGLCETISNNCTKC